jgi:hypothetical protein
MFLTSPYIDQALTLKFRLLSIRFTSVSLDDERNRDVSPILVAAQQLLLWLAVHAAQEKTEHRPRSINEMAFSKQLAEAY